MKYLGGQNLLTSHFIIGTHISNNESIEQIDIIQMWKEYKSSELIDSKYSLERTQYIDFLHEIDLKYLEIALYDLIKIYKKTHPYSEKKDFIEHVLAYTIFDIERFCSREYRLMNISYDIKNFDIYTYFLSDGREFVDTIVPNNKSIKYFKQYYKKVLELIEQLSYDDIFENVSTFNENNNKYHFSSRQWATIFCLLNYSENEPKKRIKKRLKLFTEKHNITKSLNPIYNHFFEMRKKMDINDKDNYAPPISDIESFLPFFKENYPDKYSVIENDIKILKEDSPDY